MVKKKAGLPATFELQVDKPIDLGDYLDNQFGGGSLNSGSSENSRIAEKAIPEENRKLPRVSTFERQVVDERNSEAVAEKPKRLKEPPRKQINMKPETLRKSEELLRLIQERGPQRDAAASELFDALVGALYEARNQIDFSKVPKRGRWGTPTASAFVESLKESIRNAIRHD